ncbi:MAG TPA: response regulator transcription factor [Candidatus Acidoferrales bacterium]|nr:response regulator transcription factor [Candidatus Acidoferrales bacterium]
MMRSIRILVADDHDLMRRGLKALLETRPGWEVCAEANTGREAVSKATQLRPDVVVLDVCMPELNGIEATRQIRKSSPRTEVLVLSVHHSDQLIRDALEAGARGFLVKADSDTDLVTAVESLSNRKPYFTACATEMLLNGYAKDQPTMPGRPVLIAGERLTSREREVVQLLAEGKSSKEVANTLNISAKTAETHRANIMRKLDFHSVGEIVRYAVRNQMIDP